MVTKASLALILIVGLVAAAASVSATSVKSKASEILSNNLIVGSRVSGDRLLSRQVLEKSSGWLQVQTMDVTYKTPHYETISQVRALDQKTNGNGAYASITSGGPGNRDVALHFKSQRGHSIKFVLEIYGR